MEMFETIIHIVFWIIFGYAALSVLYLFILSFAGKFFYRNRYSTSASSASNRIAILVPAYKEDGIIISTAQNLLRLRYPKEKYDVYIIADSFQPQTITSLKQLDVEVIEVAFEKSTKTKSLNEAFSRIHKPYDIALILDADNLLAADFLTRIDAAFTAGARAVQGRRVAKNLDTSFAILDAVSEGINNHIFRRGANALGLSSAVIGSGMAFEYERVKNVLAGINAVGGFDKPLQLNIVLQGIRIEYLHEALVFDEKVDSSHAFRQQRKRWVSSQFIYLKKFFLPAFRQLFRGNASYFNLALANNLVLPRAFMLILLPALLLASFFISKLAVLLSVLLFLMYISTMLLAVPSELMNRDLGAAVMKLPRAVFIMMGTLFKMKESNKTFIHTVHTKTEISNPLFNESTK